jgi:hypothetical protein
MAIAILSIAGCKHEPNPPTEQDAIAVWKNINKRPPLPNEAELISFKKTNGQSQEVNGAKMYMLYYTATKKTRVKVGNRVKSLGMTEKGRRSEFLIVLGEKAETTHSLYIVPTPIEYWLLTTYPRERW